MASGFEPGRIYELKYRASNPPVSGVGLAAIRDVASAVKYGNGAIVPVRGRYLHVYGASQSGRFLRLFLYDGFNADEQGRKVFDGVMPHIAGAGRADFNTRFSQAVGLDQFGALKFPVHRCCRSATRPPAAPMDCSRSTPRRTRSRRSSTRIRRSSIGAPAAPPRSIHTSIDGKTDLTLPANVRVYHFAGTQHGPAAFPPRAELGERSERAGRRRTAAESDAAHDRIARAAFMALDRWVRDGVEPPASKYPRLSDGTLTPVAHLKWPSLNGVASPKIDPRAAARDGDGPAGAWPFLVPQVDEDGNELGGHSTTRSGGADRHAHRLELPRRRRAAIRTRSCRCSAA